MNEGNESSKYFYIRLFGDLALFADPVSKGGGERISYPVPTAQALIGIVDACYFKPTIKNVIDEVKVINPIEFRTIGYRSLFNNYSAGLNYITALTNVEYLIKFHFEWNLQREDLKRDRIIQKHEALMKRSIDKGGRRDLFLGVREFVGYVESMDAQEYQNTTSYYAGSTHHFGILFHSFAYPKNSKEKLKSYFTRTSMENGIIKIKKQTECEIINELASSYTIKSSKTIRSVVDELSAYERGE
ncbi:MAG: type I-C CRISPR-associated protein Cas5c [Eubacteriales bacterium]|nr:type I-C CRISPR-associated protein Cas5c [Eubacteriales bacterium]